MKNPCTNGRDPEETSCPFVDEDKKCERCDNCRPRLEYAVAEGMFHPEVLDQTPDPVVIEARAKAVVRKKRGSPRAKEEKCSEDGCDLWAVAKKKCRKHYNKAY